MAESQDVAMAARPTPEETFANHLATTVRKYLKPEFDQITAQFNHVNGRLDTLESNDAGTKSSLKTIEGTLKTLVEKVEKLR